MNKILTIKQLNNYIKGVFEDEIILHDVTVCGEISEFRLIGNNTFIVLKDEDNVLSCYKFGVVETMRVGAKVKINGKVTFHPNSSRISLNIRRIEYDGEGEQRLALLQLKKRLVEEGLCNGRPLPFLIKKIGLITSAEGAVLHDFISVIGEASVKPSITVYPVRVQGSEAVTTVLKALEKANETDADLLVLARGGGSQTDLICFDNEELARKVNASKIPVLSAIGHETDYSLCDFCAAARAGTPSIAAQMVADINRKALNKLLETINRIETAVKWSFESAYKSAENKVLKLYKTGILSVSKLKDRVIKCCFSLSKCEIIDKKRKLISDCCLGLSQGVNETKSMSDRKLASAVTRLDLLSPLKVISQGYGKISVDGKEINDVADLKKGDNIRVVMRDGNADAEIINIDRRKDYEV